MLRLDYLLHAKSKEHFISTVLSFDPSPGTGNAALNPGIPSITYNNGVMSINVPSNGIVQQSGHSTSTGAAPTAVTHASSNTTSVSVNAVSNDNRGIINFTTPGSLVAGGQVDVTFAQPWAT